MSFVWPKGMQPNEQRWLMCIDIIKEVCSAENKILQKKVNMTSAQRDAGLKGGRKRNERHYQTVVEMAAQGIQQRPDCAKVGYNATEVIRISF